MNVQYSAYPAPWDFQDPGSHSIFPTGASDKPFFVLVLHRLQEGVGASCSPSRPLQARVLGPCTSSARHSNPDSFAYHHHLKQEGGSGADRKEGWSWRRGRMANLSSVWVGSQGQVPPLLLEMLIFLTFTFMPKWDTTLAYSNFVKKISLKKFTFSIWEKKPFQIQAILIRMQIIFSDWHFNWRHFRLLKAASELHLFARLAFSCSKVLISVEHFSKGEKFLESFYPSLMPVY